MENLENTPTSARLALKWGLISGLILMTYSLAMNITGLLADLSLAPMAYLAIILATGFGMWKGMDEYKETHGGYISYGQGLGLNTLISTVAAIISMIGSMLYSSFIDNSSMKKFMEAQNDKMTEQWEKQGLSQAQIEDALDKMNGMMNNPGVMFVSGVISTVFVGFILALIISAIKKKTKPVFE